MCVFERLDCVSIQASIRYLKLHAIIFCLKSESTLTIELNFQFFVNVEKTIGNVTVAGKNKNSFSKCFFYLNIFFGVPHLATFIFVNFHLFVCNS